MTTLWLLVGLAAALAQAPVDTLAYHISFPRATGFAPPSLTIAVSFRGSDTGETELVLPSRWANQDRFWEAISDLRPGGPEVRLAPTGRPHRYRLHHAPGARVTVRYVVRQDFDAPLDRQNYYRALVTDEWFHVTGYSALAFPAWEPDRPLVLTLDWDGLRPGWTVANSHGTGPGRQVVTTRLRDVLHALYVGGAFRVITRDVAGGPVAVALRGEWTFPDTAFAGLVGRIVEAERRHWGDDAFPHYLVTAIPAGTGIGGTRVHQAFATFLAHDRPLDLEVRRLLAHELMHEWIGGRLRAGDEPETRMYWFTEGFTDYFTDLVLWRRGITTAQDYAAFVNATIEEYTALPVRDAPFRLVDEGFWTDRAVGRLPYLRGHLFALRLDYLLREATRGAASLETVIRDLLARAGDGSIAVTDSVLAAALAPYLGEAGARAIHHHVREGHPIPIPPDLLGACFTHTVARVPRFVLGFDFDASVRERRITGLDPRGPAHAAGLRDGQPVRGYSVHHGDVSREATIVVEQDGERREIRYRPVAREPMDVARFTPAPECP